MAFSLVIHGSPHPPPPVTRSPHIALLHIPSPHTKRTRPPPFLCFFFFFLSSFCLRLVIFSSRLKHAKQDEDQGSFSSMAKAVFHKNLFTFSTTAKRRQHYRCVACAQKRTRSTLSQLAKKKKKIAKTASRRSASNVTDHVSAWHIFLRVAYSFLLWQHPQQKKRPSHTPPV